MTPRECLLVFVSTPLRRIVLAIFVATWLVKLLFLGAPAPLSFDEQSALKASEFSTAVKFVEASDWRERWVIVEQISLAARVLWIVAHLIWGYLFPSNGQMAYLLNHATAMVAMLALAGTGYRLYGERGFLLCLLFTSLSPLFLNYTVRVLGTMLSVMWICLGLFCLASPPATMLSWIAGGLCLGLAFGTHYGTGVAILAIACGLAASALQTLLDSDVPRREKAWRCVLAPAAGAIAALTPLVTLEFWSRHASSSYLRLLLGHDHWRTVEVGPYGLWLRELFELDPLFQVILFWAMAYTLRTASLSRIQKTLLGLGYLLMFALLIASMDKAMPRAFISLGLFGLIGLAVNFSRILEQDVLTAHSRDDEIPEASPIRSPFDLRSLAASIVVSGTIFTAWRAASMMPREAFAAWPLFVLGLVGSMIYLLPGSYHAIVRGTALLGSLLFVIGAGATYHAKSVHPRADAYWILHPHLQRFAYEDFWDTTRAGARLSTRSRYDVVVIGPAASLYPASAYEEEPYKILLFRQMLRDFNLGGVLTAEEIPWAYVFFENARAP